MTRARNELTCVVPLRFQITSQPKTSDGHVYGGRSRFLTEKVVKCFDEQTFQGSNIEVKMEEAVGRFRHHRRGVAAQADVVRGQPHSEKGTDLFSAAESRSSLLLELPLFPELQGEPVALADRLILRPIAIALPLAPAAASRLPARSPWCPADWR